MKTDSILLVTARHRLMLSACTRLEQAGFAVEATSNRAEALRVVLEERPALVLVDSLGRSSAAGELCRKLSKRSSCSVVVLTDQGQDERSQSLGVTAFVDSALPGSDLVDLVTSLLACSLRRASLAQALSAIQEGRHAEASALLSPLVGRGSKTPLSSWAAHHLSRAHELRGEVHRSVRVLEALVERQPDFWRARTRLAELQAQVEQPLESGDERPPLAELG